MAYNATNPYDVDQHIAEVYDQSETQTEDVALIRRLIGSRGPLRILEPFTGTGRILLPLLEDGHAVTGIDQAHHMLERARMKISRFPEAQQTQARLIEADVLAMDWPDGFDLVVLAGNCFYELATPEEQEACVRKAARALRTGGYVYIDNDHMEGELSASWQNMAPERRGMAGTCADGTVLEGWMQITWFDAQNRLARFHRWYNITQPDGSITVKDYTQQKHPVSAGEVREWLSKHGFVLEAFFGDHHGTPYTPSADRAIFWAKSC